MVGTRAQGNWIGETWRTNASAAPRLGAPNITSLSRMMFSRHAARFFFEIITFMSKKFRVFATCDIGEAINLLRATRI